MSQEVIDINKELAEYGINENINIEVEQNFQQLLNEISSDSSLEKFREEIEKINLAFQHTSAREKNLIKLYKDARERHYKDMQKFNKLNERTLEDRKDYDNLQKRYNILLKENQQAKEERAKENAQADSSPINDRAKDDYNYVDENLIENLEKEKEILRRQLELSVTNVEKLEKDMNELVSFKDGLENQISEMKEENVTLKDLNFKLKRDVDQKMKNNEETNTQVSILRNCITQKEIEINDLKAGIEGFKKSIEDLTLKNMNIKNELDNYKLEKSSLEKLIKNFKNEINNTKEENEKLREREKEANSNVKNLEKEKNRISKEISEKMIHLDSKDREINKLNKEILLLNTDLTIKFNENRQLSLEIEKSRKETEDEIKLKNQIMLDKKKKEKEIRKNEDQKIELMDKNRELDNDSKSKSDKLIKLKEELDIANKINAELEKTRDKITEENTKIKNKMDHLIEDIRLRENRIQELQKKVAENDKKMKMQREVYDAVRRDKNLYFKNLIDVQDDLIDKQNLLNFNKKEIEQLKSDLKKKDENIVTLKSDLSTKSDELKTKELELDRNKNEVSNLKQRVGALEKDNERLKFTVDETCKDYKKLREEYRKTVIDRDNLCKIN
jgi:chromosome segregation ATPase